MRVTDLPYGGGIRGEVELVRCGGWPKKNMGYDSSHPFRVFLVHHRLVIMYRLVSDDDIILYGIMVYKMRECGRYQLKMLAERRTGDDRGLHENITCLLHSVWGVRRLQ